jgi:hypothetical protein
MDVRPGDQRAVRQIDEWFRSWQATGDPAIANGSSWPIWGWPSGWPPGSVTAAPMEQWARSWVAGLEELTGVADSG